MAHMGTYYGSIQSLASIHAGWGLPNIMTDARMASKCGLTGGPSGYESPD